MFQEAELLTHFHKFCWNAEILALKSVHDIELPLCGFLIELTSSECIKLIRSQSDDLSNFNQPSMERILLNFLITDYISCGMSSPTFYAVFHTTLQSNKSKIKFLKDLITFWDCLFKNYEITSSNVDFVKHFVVSLERVFLKISNFDSCIKFQSIEVISKIKFNIQMFDQKILNNQILHTLSDNSIKVLHSKNDRNHGIEKVDKKKSKIHTSIPSFSLEKKQKQLDMNNFTTVINNQESNLDLSNRHQTCYSETFDSIMLKKPTLQSYDAENLPIKKIKPSLNSNMIQPEQKLNAFQVMMFNARKRKANAK